MRARHHRVDLLLGVILSLCLTPALAADFPTRPIRIIVPYPPGGVTDVVSRMAGEALRIRLGQPAVVENRPGADGIIGVDMTVKSAPDGHTMVIMPGSSLVTLPILKKSLPFDPQTDLAPMSILFKYMQFIVISSETPAKSLTELVAYAKANPGKLNRGVIGTGVLLQNQILDAALGIRGLMVPVNYKGGAATSQAIMANEIQMMTMDMVSVVPALKTGKIRVIGVTAPTRMPGFPDTPTVAETFAPGFELSSVFAFFAPARTPQDIVQKLSGEFAVMARSGPVNDYIVNKISSIPVGSTPDEVTQWMRAEYARAREAAQSINLQPE